jgi:hypothetical protein
LTFRFAAASLFPVRERLHWCPSSLDRLTVELTVFTSICRRAIWGLAGDGGPADGHIRRTAREPDQNDRARSDRMPIVSWRRYRALLQADLCGMWTAVRAAAGPTRLSSDVSAPRLSTTAPADRDRGVSDLRVTRRMDSLRRLPTRCLGRKTRAQRMRSARFTSAGAPKMAGILSIASGTPRSQKTATTLDQRHSHGCEAIVCERLLHGEI